MSKAKIPARIDGEMVALLVRKIPDCEIEISGVSFSLGGAEFKVETLEGALALIREIAKSSAPQEEVGHGP